MKKIEAELEAAKAAVLEARKAESVIRERYDREVKMPELRALIGKTFKYPRNCYSRPEKESDYWPVYVRVTGVDADCVLETVEFETNSKGEFSWKRGFWFNGVGSGYVPCPRSEYERQFIRQTRRLSPR